MYENKAGIIAVGEVSEFWNEKTYKNPIYYTGVDDNREYRIAVEWIHDLTDEPIGLNGRGNDDPVTNGVVIGFFDDFGDRAPSSAQH